MAKIRTKARALDMLGRQQIAGIPTALSELFKNAHDAYADNVEVDFFRKENLLILRDDGLGMTTDEFEERWLTIGTSSKLIDDDAINKPAVDSNKAFRPIMGEKGIGRLSIAAIGPQVLVLTRAKRDNELKPLVAAFVNWSLFAIPSLDLDDIEIPIRTIINDECFTKKTLDEMIEQARNNLDSLSHKISKSKVSQINTQLSSFEFDPILWEKKLGGLRLSGDGHGTHFIIMPTEEILIDDISTSDSNKTSEQSSRLEKALLGFTNTMYSDSNPPIIARFRDYLEDGECIDRISESIFFTPQEFNLADHHIEGWFNEFGQFSGTVSVYGEEPIHHVVTWKNNNQLTQCGPFKIKLAYIHGRLRDSRLPMELWAPLK
ncbi:TPA: ATP-binding protein, partial [Escherichia coli]